jgi:CheY-like chemotaxis protein
MIIHSPLPPSLVMIVDDNQDAAYMLGSLMETWGYRCLVANDPVTGIALAKTDPAKVFVLDIGLPTMDGYSLGAHLKQAHPDAVFIGHSAWNRNPDRERDAGFHFDYYVRKPIGFRELERLLPAITGSVDPQRI